MSEMVIHTILAATWTRYERWRIELALQEAPKRVCWLSPAQYSYLVSAFKHTKDGYSDKRCTVVGEFDDKGRYLRCKALRRPPTTGHTTPLVDDTQAKNIDHELLDDN